MHPLRDILSGRPTALPAVSLAVSEPAATSVMDMPGLVLRTGRQETVPTARQAGAAFRAGGDGNRGMGRAESDLNRDGAGSAADGRSPASPDPPASRRESAGPDALSVRVPGQTPTLSHSTAASRPPTAAERPGPAGAKGTSSLSDKKQCSTASAAAGHDTYLQIYK